MKRALNVLGSVVLLAGVVGAETVVENETGRLAVNFCRADLVHFRFAPKGVAFVAPETYVERQAIAKTDKDYAQVAVCEEKSDAGVTMRAGTLAVRVDAKTLGITVSAAGRTVFKSAAEAFAAKDAARKASFTRDVATKEHFFGLGNVRGYNFKSLELRDLDYELWLTADNVHAIVPLWYSSTGYGVYVCNSNRGRVSFKENYSLALDGGEMNFYFIWGPSFKKILTNWSELAGRMNMPPLYALGLTYRGCGGFKASEFVEAVRQQYDVGVKIDVIGIEPGWHTRAYPCSYLWSDRFPDPKGFLDQMHALGARVNFWEHPYFSPDCPIAKEMEQYGIWGGELRKTDKTNTPYGFGGLVPDFTIPAARDLYWGLLKKQLFDLGADGLKVDETDDFGAGPSLEAKFPGGIACNAYHNLLGTLTCNLVHARFRTDLNRRTFNFSRGNYAGMQRWATSAYTDFYGFNQFTMSFIVQSFSGSYYTPEIRDRETPSDIDYMRRAQMMFLTPFPMSNEWQSPANVTKRSRDVLDNYKEYNALHYALIPYTYSLFREQHLTGLGVIRALPFEFQDDPKAIAVSDEFLLGPSLLVRPVGDLRRLAKAKIYFPAGSDWIDYTTGYTYAGGRTVEYVCPATQLPLFVRKGAILPLGHFGNNTATRTDPALTLAVYPAAHEASFTVYEDDGISFDYEKGVYCETPVAAVKRGDEVTVTIGARRGAFKPAARDLEIALHYRARPTKIAVDGRTATGWTYEKNTARVRFADDGKAHTVVAQVPAEPEMAEPKRAVTADLYECEAKTSVFNGTELKTDAGEASGHALVRNLGGDKRTSFTMNGITVRQAGVYEVEIVYANGDGGARPLRLSVNGAPGLLFDAPKAGSWGSVSSFTVLLKLKEGENAIRFDAGDTTAWGPDVDCLYVYSAQPIAHDLPPTALLPHAGRPLGNAKVETSDATLGFANGERVMGMGGSGRHGIAYTVESKEAGPSLLTLAYSNRFHQWIRIHLSVNGKDHEIALAPTYSLQVAGRFREQIYLKAGKNEIKLFTDGTFPGLVAVGGISLK